MTNEKVGGISMGAEIDLGSFEQSVKKLNQMVQSVDSSAKKGELSFMALEKGSKAAAGSIEAMNQRAKQLRTQMEQLDPDTKQFTETAKRLNIVLTELKVAQDKAAKATVGMRDGMKMGAVASQALGMTLGLLGAQSIQAVVFKMVQFSREAIQMAVSLHGMENRAKAVYGTAFPEMEKEFDTLAQKTRRSTSDLMEFGTGFANLMDSVGISGQRLQTYSKELTALTVTLGQAFPDKSDADIYNIIEAGILGNTRGLKQLGITMKDKQLQDFAEREGIKLKLKDMTDEQLMMVRTQYLLQETTKLQKAASESAKEGIDVGKQFNAVWKDFSETIGTLALPAVNYFFSTLLSKIQLAMQAAGMLKGMLLDAVSFGQFSNWSSQKNAISAGQPERDANIRFQEERGIGLGAARKKLMPEQYEKEPDFWAKAPGMGDGGGGQDKALEQYKKIMADIEKIEKDILESVGKEAVENKKRVDMLMEDLKIRKQIGIITEKEQRELDRLNNRLGEGKNKIADLKNAWEKQVDVVKKARDEVQKYNEEIAEGNKDLKDRLAEIDRDGQRSRSEKVSDLSKENGELEGKLARAEGLSVPEQERLQNLESMLRGTSAQDQSLAGLNELERIDEETKQKKRDAAVESNKKLEESVNNLVQAQYDLANAESQEAGAKGALIDAMDKYNLKVTESFAAVAEATQIHTANQVKLLTEETSAVERLANAYATVRSLKEDPLGLGDINGAPVRRAGGGMVYGPGGPTGDRIPALLSDGEGIIKNAAVSYYGGPAFINAINSMRLPRFANGGVVNQSHSKSATINVHNHGRAAEVYADPRRARWHSRTFLG